MEAIRELTAIDIPSFILSVCIVLAAAKSAASAWEWIVRTFGIETRANRKRQEEHRLLVQTSQTLAALQQTYQTDIQRLMNAQREVLADRIHEKYKYYISIGGVPEDELDEFTHLHTAYKSIGGNHSGDAKYEYCIRHLPLLSVETTITPTNEVILN